MTKYHRVVIETGQKKAFASAIDWPGWSRSGKTEEEALKTLVDYAHRYQAVARSAGVRGVKATAKDMDVVEHIQGSGATDFGIPDHAATCENEPMIDAECERQIKLLRACWDYFDDVASKVSVELKKGPRGGGRDREEIVEHVYDSERSYVRNLGVKTSPRSIATPKDLREHREAVCGAIRSINASGGTDGSWPLRYAIRRIAWHVMDHAWEMEDKNLAGRDGG